MDACRLGQRRWMPWVGTAMVSMALIATAMLAPARAVEPETWQFSLGLGLGAVPDYEGSKDYTALPLFFARVDWHELFLELEGTTLRANLIPHPVLRAGPVFQVRLERDDVENDAVDALRDIDTAFEIGGFVGVEIGIWYAMLDIVQDVADAHQGVVVAFATGAFLPLSPQLLIEVGVSSTYASNDYMHAYISIDADNSARSGLSTFNADASFKDVGINFSAIYALSARWSVVGTAEYLRLLGDAADSPIVDAEGSANQFIGGLLVSYTL